MNEENAFRFRPGFRLALVLLAACACACGCSSTPLLASVLAGPLAGAGRTAVPAQAGPAVAAAAPADAPAPSGEAEEEEEEDAPSIEEADALARERAMAAGMDMDEFERNLQESKKRSCISNMRQIETAATNWLIENPGGTIGTDDWASKVVGRNRYIRRKPRCPGGGTYGLSVDAAGDVHATCTVEGHTIPGIP